MSVFGFWLVVKLIGSWVVLIRLNGFFEIVFRVWIWLLCSRCFVCFLFEEIGFIFWFCVKMSFGSMLSWLIVWWFVLKKSKLIILFSYLEVEKLLFWLIIVLLDWSLWFLLFESNFSWDLNWLDFLSFFVVIVCFLMKVLEVVCWCWFDVGFLDFL